MANIDNTVVGAVLLALSEHTSQAALWDEMMTLRHDNEDHDAKRDRFFRGQSPNRARRERLPRSWWPQRSREDRDSFEHLVKRYFMACVEREPFSDTQQQILSVCRTLGVSFPARQALAEMQDLDALIEHLFLCARREQKAGSQPQLYLAKHPVEEPSPSPSPSVAPVQALIEEGCVLTQLPPSFPPRQTAPNPLFAPQFSLVRREGVQWRLPYKELFGSSKAKSAEYVEGRNLTFAYEDWKADLRGRVSLLDFDKELEAERAAAAALGYYQHPPKLCLAHYLERKEEDEDGVFHSHLTMTFGQSGYLEHRVYQKELAQNLPEQQILQEIFRNPKGNIPSLRYCPWAACGGGVWVVTRDGFLVLSLRTNVAEEPGKISYSSSGSYGRYTKQCGQTQDNTPGAAMCKELREELGLEDIAPHDLTLISLGIDLNRCLIQFSYLLESPLSVEDILFCRQDTATTADEQILFLVSLDTPDLCWDLLEHCEFEPGAAYSLVRLLQKRFGAP